MGTITPMDEDFLTEMRAALTARLTALEAEDALGQDAQKVVVLDQQAVGRLSRMDALQNQAMAKAQAARRDADRRRVQAALARIDDGEFGYCTDCGEVLDADRLRADPALPRCASCVRG